MERVLLQVNRFLQTGPECSIAAISSLANFYDPSIDYSQVRLMLPEREKRNGLYTPTAARLLNQLGFEKVTIVTADLNVVDFGWRSLGKLALIRKLKRMRTYYGRCGIPEAKKQVNEMVQWLSDDTYDNQLVIDSDFAAHIKHHLNRGHPVGAAINWTSLFQMKKVDDKDRPDEIKGGHEEHAVVLRGYDAKSVYVVDSNPHTKGKDARKYQSGYYKLKWENFLVNIPSGDLILVDEK